MVRRILNAVYREVRGLHQAAYVLAFFTLGSQVLALFRDRLLAHTFGAGTELDLYYAAFRIPDLLFVLFASTLSVYVLIPFVTRHMHTGSIDAARGVLSSMFTLFIGVYAVAALCMFALAPFLVSVFFPGFVGADAELLALLMRIMLLQPFFLGISNLFGVITQIRNRFVLYALSPILYNFGIIVGIIALYPVFGLAGLVYGVVGGALLHLLVQVPFVRGNNLAPRVTSHIDWHAAASVLKSSIPRALTLSLHQVVLLVLIGLASLMAAGSTSVFQFAFNLQSVPLAVIGVSYSVAAFPTLAKLFSEGEREVFVAHLSTAFRHIFFWSVPFMVLGIVERAQIVRVVLGTGSFDWADTRLTAAAFGLFLISLVAQALHLLLLRGFYASGNTRTPFFITLASSGVTIVFTWLLYQFALTSGGFMHALEVVLRVEEVPGSEVLVLPLGYTVGLLLHSTILLSFFSRSHALPFRDILLSFSRSFFAALAGGWVAYMLLRLSSIYIDIDTFVEVFIQGALAGGAGVVMIGLVAYTLRSREVDEIIASIQRRIASSRARKRDV